MLTSPVDRFYLVNQYISNHISLLGSNPLHIQLLYVEVLPAAGLARRLLNWIRSARSSWRLILSRHSLSVLSNNKPIAVLRRW